MPGSTLEVAGIFRRYGPDYRARHPLPLQQLRAMRAIEICRTAALGGHKQRCGHCQHERISYNSCRNRHCPKCQNLARTQWVERRKSELLPVEYSHVVFTVPEQLNAIALQNPELFYKLLFQTSAATLETIAADPRHLGARVGFFSILHTWGQNLLHHPHVHCVVTGGGLGADGKSWISCRPGFFLPVRVLSRLFRRLLLDALLDAYTHDQLRFCGALAASKDTFVLLAAQLRRIEWVVYSKPPFGGPRQVIEYLGRYTHRVAIDNRRIQSIDNDQVTFQYKNYRATDSSQSRYTTVSSDEFIRRFLLHILPAGFQRIRHYGLLASRHKKATLLMCRELLTALLQFLPSAEQLAALSVELPKIELCPLCGIGEMIRVETLPCFRYPAIPPDSS